ncbi:Protein of unknown function [Neorhodopirellula lusitana]|uniref:DUF1552 domain-containing protein n=1 Tax=Neorhodopirellula lusitana TaxID=445327 RepID=A0ABY1QH07_9BACT|nr:DUF1552 domain-containing protein [Neorhodopirellula lusitana]SMP71331.1 Protein of unknown function [Neorhodopirellula lusitana]
MNTKLTSLDRRRFLRGTGCALALPLFESFASPNYASASVPAPKKRKRLACFYLPDGVPMPAKKDPAYQEWSWFPHGGGTDFQFTKCLEPLTKLKDQCTILGGLSHPAARNVHGHSNADQFLTGANIGGAGEYRNTISLDQVFAAQAGEQTRYSSLVMSTDGGTGTPRGAQTMSFDRNGRPIPAEHKPKRIFDKLFVTSSKHAARQLALSQNALDDLLLDARSLKRTLSKLDQVTLDEYLQSVRDTEIRVEKAKRWVNLPLPEVPSDHLNLDVTPEDPRTYVRTMFELIYLAFKTDSTRVATYQLGRENGVGASDYLARAVGFTLTHQLTHETKQPGGWENFGTYTSFLSEEFGLFASKLKATPEPGGEGTMLDNSLLFYGSASSSFHLSRNYPLILMGGQNMGFKHGQYLRYGEEPEGELPPGDQAFRSEMDYEELPLSNLYVTMLQRLGVETDSFGGNTGTLNEV